MTLTDELQVVDDKIKANQAQYDNKGLDENNNKEGLL